MGGFKKKGPSRKRRKNSKDVRLYKKHGGRCKYCGTKMLLRGRGPRAMTKDHVIPRSAGGSNSRKNLVAACARCNNLKGSMHLLDFLKMVSLDGDLPKRNEPYADRQS